jgi:hypothetical protein
MSLWSSDVFGNAKDSSVVLAKREMCEGWDFSKPLDTSTRTARFHETVPKLQASRASGQHQITQEIVMKRLRQRKLRSKSRLKVRPIREVSTARRTPNAGQFKPGNTASLRHGLYSKQLVDTAAFKSALVALEREKSDDLGGPDALSSNQRDLLRLLVKHLSVEEHLWARIAKEGPLSAKGQSRAVLSAWTAVCDRIVKLATTLGLERRAKRVPSIEDFIRERQQEKGEPA